MNNYYIDSKGNTVLTDKESVSESILITPVAIPTGEKEKGNGKEKYKMVTVIATRQIKTTPCPIP